MIHFNEPALADSVGLFQVDGSKNLAVSVAPAIPARPTLLYDQTEPIRLVVLLQQI